MAEAELVFETFKDRVGNVFTLDHESLPAVPLTLIEATAKPSHFVRPGMRLPFSLIFCDDGKQILPQSLYSLKNDELGTVTFFMVPVGRDARGVHYQALFN